MVTMSQATAMTAFVVVCLLQIQIFSVERPPRLLTSRTPNAKTAPRRMLSVSPMQGACLSLISLHKGFKPLTKGLLVSGTFYRVVAKEVSWCIQGKKCKPQTVLDFNAMWAASDVRSLAPAFEHTFKNNCRWATLACALIALGVFALVYSPGKAPLAVVGLAQLCYCLSQHTDTSEIFMFELVLVGLITTVGSAMEFFDKRKEKIKDKKKKDREIDEAGRPQKSASLKQSSPSASSKKLPRK